MKRYDAIRHVGDEILKDGLVEALFLKGSIARGVDDEYSDVDMYAVVSDENRDKFLAKRIQYLEKYMPLIYWSESNFVGPQIVGVFENGLHFDLYMVMADGIPQTDDIKIIYDKNGLLEAYRSKPLALFPKEISEYINEFSFVLLEFETAYLRKDTMWAIRLFHAELGITSLCTRFVYDKNSSKLGLKGLYKVIPEDFYREFIDVLKNATPEGILIAMKKLLGLMDKVIEELSDDIKDSANMKFYEFMKKRIFEL